MFIGSKLEKIGATFASFLFGFSAAEVKLLTPGDKPEEFLKLHKYNVMSFFDPADAVSVETDQIMQEAMAYFENKVSMQEWHERDVGWLRIDLSATPEMSFSKNVLPEQIIIGPWTHRALDFEKKESNNDVNYAAIVRNLTGDWFKPIQCDQIQAKKRVYNDEFIYFGNKADLKKDGSMNMLNDVAMMDRYGIMEWRAGFYYNEDPQCRES